ncbi:MAG: SUMF1/EgtB/PvdO family nonheme iron enzyme [Bacteroidota bacterium]
MPRPNSYLETLPDGTCFPMVLVEGNSQDNPFMMGSEEGREREKPVHPVQLDDFYLGRYVVSQGVWQAIMQNNPAKFQHLDRPIEQVSWENCQTFIVKLNQTLKIDPESPAAYRLPNEAEWEYAASGGKYAEGTRYAGSDHAYEVAWFSSNSYEESQVMALKRPNALGLYGLSGNVLEWCADWYRMDYYRHCMERKDSLNPTGPTAGDYKVVRGGSWFVDDDFLRISYRFYSHLLPTVRFNSFGLRLSRYPR